MKKEEYSKKLIPMIRNFDRITTIVAFGYQLTFWY